LFFKSFEALDPDQSKRKERFDEAQKTDGTKAISDRTKV
jgi:hypothetical protein